MPRALLLLAETAVTGSFLLIFSPFAILLVPGFGLSQLFCPCCLRAKDLIADMADMHTDQQFIEFVVKSIVNHPEDVKTERIVDERGVLITLYVNQEDMGYVIGRQGQTARALRILLKIVGAKDNARVNMMIYEPDGARREHRERKGASEGMSAPAQTHGDAGLVSDSDLADLGI